MPEGKDKLLVSMGTAVMIVLFLVIGMAIRLSMMIDQMDKMEAKIEKIGDNQRWRRQD